MVPHQAQSCRHLVSIRTGFVIHPRLFAPEDVWTDNLSLTENITLPGLSPLFPHVACNTEGSVCHFTTGEGEINAASTAAAVILSDKFDLTETYFLIGGIAGINPYTGTLASVGFAQYAIQVALAYEIDSRQIPSNWSTGYFLYGSTEPDQPAQNVYGTELFELNTNLRDAVIGYTDGVQLNDSDVAAAYRTKYDYAPANEPPAIFYGDVATSDVYFAGTLLSEAFGNITEVWTNGTGKYALTAQEDNAIFEVMVRAHKAKLLDFSRVMLMRTASDFDRAPPGVDAVTAFLAEQGAFESACQNIFIAGNPIVQGILSDWDSKFAGGIAPQDSWLWNTDTLHTLVSKRSTAGMRRRR